MKTSEEGKEHNALDHILDDIRGKISINEIRSLFSFLGIGEEHPFNLPPKNQTVLRIRSNLYFFLVNYILLYFGVMFFILLFHPLQMICTLLIASAWFVFLSKRKLKQSMEICGNTIGDNEIILVMGFCTAILIAFFLISSMLMSTAISGFVGTMHALIRETRLRDEGPNFRRKGQDEDSPDNV